MDLLFDGSLSIRERDDFRVAVIAYYVKAKGKHKKKRHIAKNNKKRPRTMTKVKMKVRGSIQKKSTREKMYCKMTSWSLPSYSSDGPHETFVTNGAGSIWNPSSFSSAFPPFDW
jgi:hypothetical protein